MRDHPAKWYFAGTPGSGKSFQALLYARRPVSTGRSGRIIGERKAQYLVQIMG